MTSNFDNKRAEILQWATRLLGGEVSVTECRPGQRMSVGHHSESGGPGTGRSHVTDHAVWPEETLRGKGLGGTMRVSRSWPSDYSLEGPPVTAPTLVEFTYDFYGPHGSEMKWYGSKSTSWTLFFPTGETEEAYQKRLGREFAARVRQQLADEYGLSGSIVGKIFTAASVSLALDAAELAKLTRKEQGDGALLALQQVYHAPYGRARRLEHLAELGVSWRADSAGRLSQQLAGAIVSLGGNLSDEPPHYVPREKRKEYTTSSPTKATTKVTGATLADLARKYAPGKV